MFLINNNRNKKGANSISILQTVLKNKNKKTKSKKTKNKNKKIKKPEFEVSGFSEKNTD